MDTVCYVIDGIIECESPLHIGSGERIGIIHKTRTVIPGSMLRGVFGAALIKLVCQNPSGPLKDHAECRYVKECAYARLYGEEDWQEPSNILFRFSYPIHEGCGGVFQQAPRNYMECDSCGFVSEPEAKEFKCGKCGSFKLKPYVGYICSRCGYTSRMPLKLRRIVGTAVDRSSNSAAQIPVPGLGEKYGTLHSFEVVERGSKFHFELVVDGEVGDLLDLCRNVLEKALPEEGLGGERTRGFGHVRVKVNGVKPVDRGEIEKRAEQMDLRRFRVVCLSPMVLKDGFTEGLKPPTLLESARKAYTWAFREGLPSLTEPKLVDRRVAVEGWSNWSLKEDRRNPILPAFSAGSLFEYSCEAEDEKLRLSLAALEYKAVGRWKPKGFGQIAVR
jgi:CRISPR/Cas system CSM-associated protein Csm3 (group 7 of RAMP superfamily)